LGAAPQITNRGHGLQCRYKTPSYNTIYTRILWEVATTATAMINLLRTLKAGHGGW